MFADKRGDVRREGFDVGGFVVIVQGDLLGVQGDVAQGLTVKGSYSDDGFAAFDFDTAEFHVSPLDCVGRRVVCLGACGQTQLSQIAPNGTGVTELSP
ncbi:hypothetical protein D3C71_1440190 [compost metagenome]